MQILPSQNLTYESAAAALAHMQLRGWRMGLDRMEAFCESLGVPRGGKAKFLHVAGTNGKGSVTANIQSILVEQGVRTGAYYSPYVYELRERVQLNRDLISKADFARIMSPIVETADEFLDSRFGGPTEFEAKTALGFLFWEEQECEAVALEVGLGGRLDATNIVDPAVSVIVSIGLDHTAYLGDTLAAIAGEKAGIIKPGKPVVVGDLAEEAMVSVLRAAKECNSPVWRFGKEIRMESGKVSTPGRTYENVSPALLGVVQGHNSALALAAVEAAGLDRDPDAMVRGVASTRLPGRMETIVTGMRTVILDGAHNREAAQVLAETLSQTYPGQKWSVVAGMLEGHDPVPFFSELKDLTEEFLIVPVPDPRGRNPKDLAKLLESHGLPARGFDSIRDACQKAADMVLVTGSFYLLGPAKEVLAP